MTLASFTSSPGNGVGAGRANIALWNRRVASARKSRARSGSPRPIDQCVVSSAPHTISRAGAITRRSKPNGSGPATSTPTPVALRSARALTRTSSPNSTRSIAVTARRARSPRPHRQGSRGRDRPRPPGPRPRAARQIVELEERGVGRHAQPHVQPLWSPPKRSSSTTGRPTSTRDPGPSALTNPKITLGAISSLQSAKS